MKRTLVYAILVAFGLILASAVIQACGKSQPLVTLKGAGV